MEVEIEPVNRKTVHWRNARIGYVYQSTKHADHFIFCAQDNTAVVLASEKLCDIGNVFRPGLDTAWIPCESKLIIQPMS